MPTLRTAAGKLGLAYVAVMTVVLVSRGGPSGDSLTATTVTGTLMYYVAFLFAWYLPGLVGLYLGHRMAQR